MTPLLDDKNPTFRNALMVFLLAVSLPTVCFSRSECVDQSIPTGDRANIRKAADGTLSCPLQEGETIFVVLLPKGSQRDHFTFVNENAAARGELKLSVSNDKLPPGDPKWTSVDGTIAFNHKRLFNLSMVGVEATYVKLSFRVEKGDRIAAVGL